MSTAAVTTATGPAGCGAVAAGSGPAAEAAAELLRSGGGAVDAVLAAGFAAAVAEPGLSSLGGGGFLLHREPGGGTGLLDFFVDTPGLGRAVGAPAAHFTAVTVHFPGADQVFHAGWGSVAVPGVLAGYLEAHRRWGRLPLADIVAPAARFARTGVPLEPAQAQVLALIADVLSVTPDSAALYCPGGRALRAGERFANPAYADLLAAIADGSVRGADDAAYADPLLQAMDAHGGLVTHEDLAHYAPVLRPPLSVRHGAATVVTNPPPSYGGSIVADALAHLRASEVRADDVHRWGEHVRALRAATRRRRAADLQAGGTHVPTGTTHVSVIDGDGGVASMTTSNGSCSGTLVPGWGVQLNNMLGEEDLNPRGFHALPPAVRMGSMMAPSLVEWDDGAVLALGSGGSERIRSALLSVLVRVLDLGRPLPDAVAEPRVHPDGEVTVQVEPGLPEEVLTALGHAGDVHAWSERDLYFGGVHAVRRDADGGVLAVGDLRRGGAVAVVPPR